jgi:hypothetical protein
MAKTIVAMYNDPVVAQRVIDGLIEAGFSADDISLLVKDAHGILTSAGKEDVTSGEGAGFGALIGALVGIGTALVPGIGPVVGTGLVAVALTVGIGAAAGALTGGVTAGLLDLDVDAAEANNFANGMHWGGTIVSLTTKEDWIEWAQRIMERHKPLKIEERPAKWFESDWSSAEMLVEWNADSNPHLKSTLRMERPRSSPAIKRVQRVRVYNYDN